MYLGIDNGVSGAMALLDDGGNIMAVKAMPVVRARKGNEVDIRALDAWHAEIGARGATIVLEEPGGSKSYKAAVSMAASFHAIRGWAMARLYRMHRVTPQQWQKAMLPGCGKGETKARAMELANRLWPEREWMATPKSKVPHDGIVDAALIAEWARREGL